MAMKLSCATWSFPYLDVEQTVALAGTLGISGVDQGLFYRGALDKQLLLTAPESLAKRVRALPLPTPCYFHLFGAGLAARNCADPDSRVENGEDFEKVAVFCEAAGVATVFVSPGIINVGQSPEQSIDESARTFESMLVIARRHGVVLTVEPHVGSNVESPAAVIRLLEKAPGLRLTLDYSHLVCLGYTQAQIDVLVPWASHVHLRQAAPGRLQEQLQLGTINFTALLSTLQRSAYDRWLTLEYCHQQYMNMCNVDVISETVKLRDLLTPQLERG